LLVILVIVVLLIIGWAVVGLALKLLWWALLGLFIGALARLILPGRQAIGWLATAGAGIGGALLGGIIANALDLGSLLQFIVAVAGAAALIVILGGARRSLRLRRESNVDLCARSGARRPRARARAAGHHAGGRTGHDAA
jgi:uncharacterized membrane protein YeaQ/YmgE (transglycosylase-associated protein family)